MSFSKSVPSQKFKRFNNCS